jgi:hypothetical protein
MVDPVLRGIQGEGEVSYSISVDFVIEFEEDTEADMRQHGMGRFGENVIA